MPLDACRVRPTPGSCLAVVQYTRSPRSYVRQHLFSFCSDVDADYRYSLVLEVNHVYMYYMTMMQRLVSTAHA